MIPRSVSTKIKSRFTVHGDEWKISLWDSFTSCTYDNRLHTLINHIFCATISIHWMNFIRISIELLLSGQQLLLSLVYTRKCHTRPYHVSGPQLTIQWNSHMDDAYSHVDASNCNKCIMRLARRIIFWEKSITFRSIL